MRSLDQFKSSLGSSASSGAAKSFQISSRQPSYSNSSGSFANLKLVAEKLVKEQASSKTVPGDSPKWVRHCTNEDYVAMASQNGLVILSSCEIIRALGRNTRGAVAMRLKEGDRMACVDIIPAAKQDGIESVPGAHHGHKPHGPWLLFVSKNGFGKRVPLSRFRQSPLNRVGLIGYKFSSEDCLAAVFVVGFTTADDGEAYIE